MALEAFERARDMEIDLALVSLPLRSAGDAQDVVFPDFEVRNIQIAHAQQLRVLVSCSPKQKGRSLAGPDVHWCR